jgi:protein SCO1/2
VHRPPRVIGIVGLAGCSLLLLCASACRQLSNAAGSSDLNAMRYHVHGVVLGKSPSSRQITLDQAAVANIMPATSAVYAIPNARIFQVLQPGDSISADAILPTDNNPHNLVDIAVLAQARSARALSSLPPHQLLVGEAVPSIPMVNQDGKSVDLAGFRGKAVLITFVDTQCTEDCPIITRRFRRIDELLARDPKVYDRILLITVSIDPAHDTPPVLHRYGLQYLHGNAAGFAHWEFVDLTPANLYRLATGFGVMYTPSRGDIVHSMDVSLIGANNTLLQSWDGDHWDPHVIAKAVAAAATTGQPS